MHKYIWATLLLLPASVWAMGDKPEDPNQPEKIIVESQELCDPQEETEMPRFY